MGFLEIVAKVNPRNWATHPKPTQFASPLHRLETHFPQLAKNLASLHPHNWSRPRSIDSRCSQYESLNPSDASSAGDDDDLGLGAGDGNLWDIPISDWSDGQFSFSAVRGRLNLNVKDDSHGQVDTAPGGLFVGLYDGHQFGWASEYVAQVFMHHLLESARKCDGISTENVIRDAIRATEECYSAYVLRRCEAEPELLTYGSCCHVGLIWDQMLYIGNLGDSRAVLGYYNLAERLEYKQLTSDHNANVHAVREELQKEHGQDERDILKIKGESWCLKGKTELTRSIGFVYMKDPDHQVIRYTDLYKFDIPITKPVMRSDPDVFKHPIGKEDRFLIFGSNELWKHLSNDEVVRVVHQNPRKGSAKRLIIKALLKITEKEGKTYDNVKKKVMTRGLFHNDIVVVVVFLGNGPTEAFMHSDCRMTHWNGSKPSEYGLFKEFMEEGCTSGMFEENENTFVAGEAEEDNFNSDAFREEESTLGAEQ